MTATCGSGRTGSFQVDVSGASSPYVQVVFTHSGSGSFTVAVPSGWILSSGTTYLAPVVGGAARGTAQVSFTIGQNGTATVTASISASSGQPITGRRSASITKHREGNSGNYTCTAA